MKIEKVNPKKLKSNISEIDGQLIFDSINRYVNSKGISKNSILHKFETLKLKNEEKNKKLINLLEKYQNKMNDIRKEINELNSNIESNIQKIKSSLS